jgi:O-antigen biosynthesis protein
MTGEGRVPSQASLVSVVVATRDRPGQLRRCLQSLVDHTCSRPVEIIVVDNNPASGQTPPVVAAYPDVRLVSESRRGLAYARNRGFVASRGAIVATTDDDVLIPKGWLDGLLTPFAQPDVAAVTGNVLPLELATRAQRLFESYGGLGRGPSRKVADLAWFRSFRSAVPTWTLGATANAAFRAAILGDSRIGLMDEALGPGTPTGVGEDTYLFYKILRAGHTIVYEPSAFVWHEHRREMRALRRQIYDYSCGHVAYHLTTLLRDGDLRALPYLGLVLPGVHAARLLRRLVSKSEYPCAFILLEILGNLAGPWAWLRSQRRVRREGRIRSGVDPLHGVAA